MRTIGTGWSPRLLPTAVFAVVLLSMGLIPRAEAEEASQFAWAGGQNPTDTAGRFRVQATFFGGAGVDEHKVGEAAPSNDPTDTEDLTISGGGGMGGSITLGYAVIPSLEVSLAAGFQNSTLSPSVDNADGSFSRTVLQATLAYAIPVGSSGQVKLGGGMGYYIPGDLDLDFSELSGGGHNVYGYNAATGFHITGGYEHVLSGWSALSATWSWGVGVTYYGVTYELDSATMDGVSTPIESLPAAITDELGELDGGGYDLTLFIAMRV